MYYPLVAMEMGFTSCNYAFSKVEYKDFGTRNDVWTQKFLQGWKNQNIKKTIYSCITTSENWRNGIEPP